MMLFAEGMSRVMATVPELMYGYSSASFSLPLPAQESKHSFQLPECPKSSTTSPFLKLPVEIRQRIYSLLFLPQTYTIVPAMSYPASTVQSLFPYPQVQTPPYRLLKSSFNQRGSRTTLNLAILFVSRQIHDEVLPVFYGSPSMTFAFGTSTHLIDQFFSKRNHLARESVRSISIAKEVIASGVVDQEWQSFCLSLQTLLPNLRWVELTLWSSNGSGTTFPITIDEVSALSSLEMEIHHGESTNNWEEQLRASEWRQRIQDRWSSYPWLEPIFKIGGLRKVSIRWWDFDDEETSKISELPSPGHDLQATSGQQARRMSNKMGIGAWLGGNMVIDENLRGRIIQYGGVREGRFAVGL